MNRCVSRLTALATLALVACAAPGENKDGPGFIDQVKAALPLGKPNIDKPLITSLKPGRFEPSSIAIGEDKDLARNRGDGLGFVRSATAEQYLNALRKKLEAASGITHVPGRVVVLANPAFAAHASADGNIYVAMGWLIYLENEDEMAAILAHELSHVLLRHHSADLVTKSQKMAQSMHELGVNAKMAIDKVKTTSQRDQKAIANVQLLTDLGEKLVMPAWGRAQEREADLLGADLMAKAGFASSAMITMLEKLREWEKNTRASEDAFWQRVRDTALTDFQQSIKMTVGSFVDKLSTSHPDTNERINDLAAYLDRHHGDALSVDPKADPWNAFRNRLDVKGVVNNYDVAFKARKNLDGGKLQEAYELAKSSVQGPTLSHAYPNWIYAQTATAMGRNDEAAGALERAINSTEPVRELYDKIVLVQEQRGQYAVALQWTNKASAAFGEAENWLPTKIRLLRKSGKTKEADALVTECAIKAPEWRKQCQEANVVAGAKPAAQSTPAITTKPQVPTTRSVSPTRTPPRSTTQPTR